MLPAPKLKTIHLGSTDLAPQNLAEFGIDPTRHQTYLQWASDMVANKASAFNPIEGFRDPVLLLIDGGEYASQVGTSSIFTSHMLGRCTHSANCTQAHTDVAALRKRNQDAVEKFETLERFETSRLCEGLGAVHGKEMSQSVSRLSNAIDELVSARGADNNTSTSLMQDYINVQGQSATSGKGKRLLDLCLASKFA